MVRPNNSIGKDAGSTFPAKPNDVAGIGELAIKSLVCFCCGHLDTTLHKKK